MLQIIKDVQKWAKEKGIYDKSTADTQLLMAYIELGEFSDAVLKNAPDAEKATELGDVIVCLINYIHMMHYDDNAMVKSLEQTLNCVTTPQYGSEHINADLVIAFDYLTDISLFCWKIAPVLANYCNHTLYECLELAYNKINKRKGKMINGKFVKSSDL